MSTTRTAEERIASVETENRQTRAEIHALADRIETFASEVRSAIRDITQPRYERVISVVALIVTIGVLVFAPVMRDMERIEDNAVYHRRLGGHPEMEERIAALEKREEERQVTLRREMALRDLALCERLAALEERTKANGEIELRAARPCSVWGIQ